MRRNGVAILAAEADPVQAARLFRSLALLGHRAELATSAEKAMESVRRNLFTRAVVAMELIYEGRPVLARLARLSSIECLIATGPAGDPEMEKVARLSGADLYLARPVTIESLAKALRPRVRSETPGRSGQ